MRRGGRRLTAFDRLPIRVRLAAASALLTFVILLAFAVAIGSLTVHRVRSDFNRQVAESAKAIPHEITRVTTNPFGISPPLQVLAPAGDQAVIRIYDEAGDLLRSYPDHGPDLDFVPARVGYAPVTFTEAGYRVVTRRLSVLVWHDGTPIALGRVFFQFARPVAPTEATVHRVELFLIVGVIAGSVLALIAGMAIARRAMAPIASLTSTAAEIARTRDLSQRMPEPQAEDEVAELTRTLEGMLRELDAARSETESLLVRQRRFVADASHELRTPLTSVLANLELLADSLHGDHGEAARSALRSSQRMRRLVADLLLLARTDAAREQPRAPLDLAQIVVEAAAELGPVSGEHEITLEVHPARLEGVRDELHRLTINLIENALRHTPPGTEVQVSTRTLPDGEVELAVADNGPGVPPELAPTLFERFVRGAGDRGGSFGLGLAIVYAVAGSHGGSVALEPPPQGATGARFVVRLPGAPQAPPSQREQPVLADRAV